MLRTRLIVGSVLAALTAGMLIVDRELAPWFPFLLVVVIVLAVGGTVELWLLFPRQRRPRLCIVLAGVITIVLLNWGPVLARFVRGTATSPGLAWVVQGFAAFVMVAFLMEMTAFTGAGGAVDRVALTVWMIAYLGLLPCFLVQQQLGRLDHDAHRGAVSLALAIFVPKGCDIGAYFTGRFLGRHRMAPILSPKKTWEGAIGGLALAVVIAFGLNAVNSVIPLGWMGIVGFGLTVGLTGMFGDLAESLIKRDCERKDASQVVPGFGGILDVVDAILFAAPVSYWWLH